jgi:hypothetical protein
MSLIQCDDMIQNLSATTSSPAFRRSILPGRLDTRSLRFQVVSKLALPCSLWERRH